MAQPVTSDAELERVLARLREKSDELARLSIASRIQLLRAALAGYAKAAPAAVRAICAVKGLDPDSNEAGEEWLVGPMVVLRAIRLTIETLERLDAGQPVIDATRVRTRPDGRVVVDAFPMGAIERALYSNYDGEVLMQAGMSAEDVLLRAASHYETDPSSRRGVVALVLGAGNVSSIPTMDVLYKMFVEGKTCVLKMNPVNEDVGPYIAQAFEACVARGYLAVVYGGGDVGGRLVHHRTVDEIHMTGSDKTYDLLVWGPPGHEREERKAKNTPLLDKPFSSELGNISPWIIAPGDYSEAELDAVAENIAAAVANNASFNCNSAKIIVLPKGWSGGPRLLDKIAGVLGRAKPRRAYYPGAEDRWKRLVDAHPNVTRVGSPSPGELSWAIIRDVDPADNEDLSFHLEPWCSVISQVAIPGHEPAAFLSEAVAFVNDRVWGTLSATVIAPPRWLKTAEGAAALDRALLDLRYGVVSVNCWTAAIYTSGRLPWGGHPSVTSRDIQSGLGWVHNTFMLEGIEKSILRSPLIVRPKPPYFIGHRSVGKLGRRLAELEANWSPWRLPGVVAAALAG